MNRLALKLSVNNRAGVVDGNDAPSIKTGHPEFSRCGLGGTGMGRDLRRKRPGNQSRGNAF
jgi:hypothetical protein